MKAASAKAKGRRSAKQLQRLLLEAFPELEEGDLIITPSGVNGPDLMLSPRAKKVLPFDFEVKNVERLNVWQALNQLEKRKNINSPVLVFRRNRSPMYVCMPIEVFIDLIAKGAK